MTTPKVILVVEDSRPFAEMVAGILHDNGFTVSTAYSKSTGLAMWRSLRPDVTLLDVRLGESATDGRDICEEIRRSSTSPVIMLTEFSGPEDATAGLEAGADDFVGKSHIMTNGQVHAGVLLARIATALRHAQPSSRRVMRCGDLEIDFAGEVVRKAGRPVELTGTEWSLLAVLATNRGQTVHRWRLLELVWERDLGDGDQSLVPVTVSRLRRKVDPGHRLILTVPGRGYRLDCP